MALLTEADYRLGGQSQVFDPETNYILQQQQNRNNRKKHQSQQMAATMKAGPPGMFAMPVRQPMAVSTPPFNEVKNSLLESEPFQFKASLADRLAASNLELDFELYCPSAQTASPFGSLYGLRVEDEVESNSGESNNSNCNNSISTTNTAINSIPSKKTQKTKGKSPGTFSAVAPSTATPTSDLESCIAELLRKHMMPETGSQEGQSSSGDMTPYSDEGSASLPMLLRRTLTATTITSDGAGSDSHSVSQSFAGLGQFANSATTNSAVFTGTPTMTPLAPMAVPPLGRGHCLGLTNPCLLSSNAQNVADKNSNSYSSNLFDSNANPLFAPFNCSTFDSPLLSAEDAPPGLGGLCSPLPPAFPATTPTPSATVATAAGASPASTAVRPTTAPVIPAGKFTTVMLRNIPSKLTQRQLMKQVSSMGYRGKFDFLYIPMDSRRRSNRGIAFINFSSPAAAKGFIAAVQELDMNSEAASAVKGVEVLAADVQGFDKNVEWHAETLLSKTETHKPLVLRRVSFPKLAQVVAEAAEKKSSTAKGANTTSTKGSPLVPSITTDGFEADGRPGPRPPRSPEVSSAQLQRSISGSSSFSGSGSTGSTVSVL